MRPKTAATIALLVLVAVLVFLFYWHNRVLLATELLVLGMPFKLIKIWVASLLMVAAVPTVLLSYRSHLKSRRIKAVGNDARDLKSRTERLREVENLIALGALNAASEALSQIPASPDRARLEGRIHLAAGRTDKAIGSLQRAFEQVKDAISGFALVDALTKSGRVNAAVDVLNRMAGTYPGKAFQAYRQLLGGLEKRSDWDAALNMLAHFEQEQPQFFQKKQTGYQYQRLKDRLESDPYDKAARDELNKLVARCSEFVPALLLWGDCLMRSGEVKKAFDRYEQGYQKTQHPVFLSRMEDYYLERDRPEDALQVYRRLVASKKGIAAVFQLAKLYRKLEMTDECLDLLERTIRSSTRIPVLGAMVAELHARRERFEEAYNEMREIVRRREFPCGDYVCHTCHRCYETYRDRCEDCGEWGQIDLDVKIRPHASIASAPVYS